METKVIQSFPLEELFNFKKEADSMLGYKHTAEAIEKMKLRFVDKTNHPMFGKNHTLESLSFSGIYDAESLISCSVFI